MSIRNVALENVIKILEEKKPLHKVLADSLADIADLRDKAFLSRLVRGCIERTISIDLIIDSVSSVKVKKQKPVIRNILRCGVYQILFMDSVTDFAACDEAVKLAGKRGFGNLRGFVNGVLRNICRKKEELLEGMNRPGRNNMVYKYSVPEWLVNDLCDLYDEEKAEKSFDYFMNESRISIRVNNSRINCSEFENNISGIEGIKTEKNKFLPGCYYFCGSGSIEKIKGFSLGHFVVQDMSSALVGYCAGKLLHYGKNILDLCAAPGGKSINMADMGAKVTSCDISEQKISLIREASERCRFDNISVMINDALIFNHEFEGKYDIVLCDLPCSGIGIIGKKPDIKYNVTRNKIAELSNLQKKILRNAVRYVKNGGFLIYSTCTVTKEENTDNSDFIQTELGLKGLRIADYLPDAFISSVKDECYIQLLPGEYECDGFFISLFTKSL